MQSLYINGHRNVQYLHLYMRISLPEESWQRERSEVMWVRQDRNWQPITEQKPVGLMLPNLTDFCKMCLFFLLNDFAGHRGCFMRPRYKC